MKYWLNRLIALLAADRAAGPPGKDWRGRPLGDSNGALFPMGSLAEGGVYATVRLPRVPGSHSAGPRRQEPCSQSR